jgi:hypothetical protein
MANRIYKITVEGQYMSIGDASGSKVIKKYQAEFRLQSMEAALSVIVSKLLDLKLKQMYPDYVTYRTHRIIRVEVEGPKPSTAVLSMAIEQMSMQQLADFCILRELQVDPLHLADIGKAREMVSKSWDEKRARMKDEAAAKQDSQKDDDLLALNELTRDEAPVKLIFAPAALSTEAHTPGAPVVERVANPVEPSDAPLPALEPDKETIE